MNEYMIGKYIEIRKQKRRMEKPYEQFIRDWIKDNRSIDIGLHETRHEQLNIGESEKRIEIKHDHKFQATGNLFIETDELTSRDKWIRSGICKEDNALWYLIGNRNEFWLFNKENLFMECLCKKQQIGFLNEEFKDKNFPTSKGFLLRTSEANKICVRHIIIQKDKHDEKKSI